MTYCSLEISLDDKNKIYHPEDKITGTIIVRVLEDCECKQLMLYWQWRTHGKGDRASGTNYQIQLARDVQWWQGHEYTYEFEFLLPDSPYTYHGHYINVDWYLDAKAEFSWGLNRLISGKWRAPQKTSEIFVEPLRERLKVVWFKSIDEPTIDDLGLVGGVVAPLMGALFIAAGIVDKDGFLVLGGLISLAIGVYLLFRYLPNTRLGEIRAQVSALEDDFGLRGTIQITPKRVTRLNLIKMRLEIEEQAVENRGSSQKTHKRAVFADGYHNL